MTLHHGLPVGLQIEETSVMIDPIMVVIKIVMEDIMKMIEGVMTVKGKGIMTVIEDAMKVKEIDIMIDLDMKVTEYMTLTGTMMTE